MHHCKKRVHVTTTTVASRGNAENRCTLKKLKRGEERKVSGCFKMPPFSEGDEKRSCVQVENSWRWTLTFTRWGEIKTELRFMLPNKFSCSIIKIKATGSFSSLSFIRRRVNVWSTASLFGVFFVSWKKRKRLSTRSHKSDFSKVSEVSLGWKPFKPCSTIHPRFRLLGTLVKPRENGRIWFYRLTMDWSLSTSRVPSCTDWWLHWKNFMVENDLEMSKFSIRLRNF